MSAHMSFPYWEKINSSAIQKQSTKMVQIRRCFVEKGPRLAPTSLTSFQSERLGEPDTNLESDAARESLIRSMEIGDNPCLVILYGV